MPHGERDLELAFRQIFRQEGIELTDSLMHALARGLVAAVEFGTEKATQNIAAMHRRRLVTQTAAATATITALIVGFSVWVITKESTASSLRQVRAQQQLASHRAEHNCQDITRLARVQAKQNRAQNLSSERFIRESKDRLGLSERGFHQLIVRARHEREAQLVAIEAIAHEDCEL